MKAEITANGVLCVSAETELEAYALGRWTQENTIAGNLEICRAVPEKKKEGGAGWAR